LLDLEQKRYLLYTDRQKIMGLGAALYSLILIRKNKFIIF
jgi:hypothetical protein